MVLRVVAINCVAGMRRVKENIYIILRNQLISTDEGIIIKLDREMEVKLVEENLIVWNESFVRMMGMLKRYVTQLQSLQPVDALGRVTSLVNPQAVLSTGFTSPIDNFVDAPPEDTLMPISYLEGLPTIDGVPIWEKLEGERIEYYELFKRYRSMKDAKTQRAVFKLALESGVEVKHLEMLRQIYHWNIRVQAYDVYLAEERAVQLELRRLEIEGKHAKVAEKLFDVSSKYLTDHPELLTPKVALQMLDMATKLERISSGLSPDMRQTTRGVDRPAIMINNNIGQDAQVSQSDNPLVTGNVEKDKERLTQVLNIMNNIGLLQDNPEVVEVEVDDSVPEE